MAWMRFLLLRELLGALSWLAGLVLASAIRLFLCEKVCYVRNALSDTILSREYATATLQAKKELQESSLRVFKQDNRKLKNDKR
jgi:hypothetical protein